jgi:hypothetical protein
MILLVFMAFIICVLVSLLIAAQYSGSTSAVETAGEVEERIEAISTDNDHESNESTEELITLNESPHADNDSSSPAIRAHASWIVEQEHPTNSTLQGRVSMRGRFWMRGAKTIPWRWRVKQTALTDLHPTEAGWRDSTTCETDHPPFAIPPNRFKNNSLFDAAVTFLPRFDSCVLGEEFQCPQRVELPEFEFIPERRPYTLADTINAIAVGKGTSSVHILFVGDSTMEDIFNWAKCSLSRTSDVSAVDRGSKMFKMPHGERLNEGEHVRWYRTALFDIVRKHSSSTKNNNIRAQISLARNDEGFENHQLFNPLCEGTDLIVVNWGLHFTANNQDKYDRMLEKMLPSLSACAKTNTAIAFLSHPAQHFPESPNGWYSDAHISPNRRCVPIVNSVEDADWNSQSLRTAIGQLPKHVLVPTPWVFMQDVVNTNRYCRRGLYYNNPDRVRIHHIPFFDVSASLWDWHLNRTLIRHTKTIDCTHLLPITSFGTPIWDALFWTALSEVSKQTCTEVTPPKYEVGKRQCAAAASSASCAKKADATFRANVIKVLTEPIQVPTGNASAANAEADVFRVMKRFGGGA